jgi:hypothetical protein
MSNEVVTADAVTERKVSKQHPIVPTLLCKVAIQTVKEVHGLKNDGEAVEALIAAILGAMPREAEGESEETAGERVGAIIAKLEPVSKAAGMLDATRRLRKLERDARRDAEKAKERADEMARLKALEA